MRNILLLLLHSICIIPSSILAQFTITPSLINATCPSSSDGSIVLSVTGGAAPYMYQWSPGGSTTAAITGLTPGPYTVMLRDNAGADSVLAFTIGPSPISDNAQVACSIELLPTGGTAPFNFEWNDGSVGASHNAGRGSFSVVVRDANNCTASFSYVIGTECTVEPSGFFTPNGDDFNETWFIANAQYFDDIHLIVFDRWGIKVHEQRGVYQPWDGKSSLGISVPVSVYYYFFYENRKDKQKDAKAGSVTIMR